MALRESLVSFSRYWKRIVLRFAKDVWVFWWQQVIIALCAALIILALQIRFGLIPKELTWYGFLSVAAPYLVIAALSIIFHALRVPWITDTELRAEIEELKIKLAAEIPLEEKINRLNAVVTRGYELLFKYQDESSSTSLNELMHWMGLGMGNIQACVGQQESLAFGHCLKQLPPNCPVVSEEHRTALSFLYPRIRRLEKHVEKLKEQSI
jgi:hypothetical protein